MRDPLASLTEEAPLNHTILNATCLKDYIGIKVTDKVKKAIKADANYQEILKIVGTVSRKDIHSLGKNHPAKELQSIWGLVSKVTVGEGEDAVEVILVDSTRLYVPTSERASVLSLLHQAHTGITGLQRLPGSLSTGAA